MPENDVLDALVGAIAERMGQKGYKHDLATGFTLTTNFMHGPSGIFGAAGLERDVFSTRITPEGLMKVLPAFPSVDDTPIVAYLTGITAEAAADEKDEVCDTPREVGQLKSCYQGAAFGRIERKTQPIELNAIGRRNNRGEFYDLRIVNDPMQGNDISLSSQIPSDLNALLNREMLSRFYTLGAGFQNVMGPLVWTGDPTNNSAGGGYQEWVGLETLVGTGKYDVLTETLCPSLDSDVKDFNYGTVTSDTNALLQALTMITRFVRRNAVGMGFMPVQWAFVMRRDLFYEISDVWPCAYASYRCTFGTSDAELIIDGERQRQMADQMRNGEYLLIDGVKIPVIIDDFIPEDTSTTNQNVPEGYFSSDIYLLPLTVVGGMAATFWEYFNYDGMGNVYGAATAIADARLGDQVYTSDAGRFMWTSHRTGWCIEVWAKIEPRLRLLTPHLAGRLQNVMYSPLQHFRDPNPDSDYFADGGETTRTNAPYSVTGVR